MPRAIRLPPFQTLVEDHAGAVAGYLRGMLGAEDSQDALQETYIAALRAYPRFDGANPRAWLLTIARRKAIDAHRSSARRPAALEEPDALPAEDRVGPGAELGGGALRRAVEALPPKQREAVVLRFGADLRYREIGIAMGCSEAAARRSVHEAITKLRKSTATREEVRA